MRAAAEDPDPVLALRRMGRAYIQFGLDHPEQYRIMFMTRWRLSSDDFDQRLIDVIAFGDCVRAVERCLAAGRFRPAEPRIVAAGLWTTVHGITSLLIAKPNFPWPPRDVLLNHLMDTVLEGLLVHPE